MKTTDLFTRNRSAQRLNESLSKMFGTQLDLDSFDTPKLEDARNKLRTQIHTARQESGFNETIENETLSKAQFMHDAIVAELMDRQEHIVDTTVEEGAAAGYDPETQARIKAATPQQLSQMAQEFAGGPSQYQSELKMLQQAKAELSEQLGEGADIDRQELMMILKQFDENMNEIGGYGDPDFDKILAALNQGDVESAVEEVYGNYSDQDGGEIRSNDFDNYLEDLEDQFKDLVGGSDDDEGGETDDAYALSSAGFGSDEDYESVQHEEDDSGQDNYDKILNAIAALYGDDIWDNDSMQDLANDLMQADPSDKELDFIIAKGKLPRRLADIEFTDNDSVKFGEDSRMRDFSRQDQLDHEDEIQSRMFNRLQNRITRQRGSHVAGVDIERWLKPYQILLKNNLKPKETGDRFEYLLQVALKLKGTDTGFDSSTGISNAYKIFNLDHSEQKLIAKLIRSAPKTSELEKYLKDSLDEVAQAKTDDNFRAYLAQRKADKGGRDAYQRDYDSSVSGMGRSERDPADWDEGNTEPPNNFAVSINGKKWKVFKGRGKYAEDAREQAHYEQLKDWARKKSESTGKNWTVSITGENPTESINQQEDMNTTEAYINNSRDAVNILADIRKQSKMAELGQGDPVRPNQLVNDLWDVIQWIEDNMRDSGNTESVNTGDIMTRLQEGEVQQASAIVTAKTMVDRVSRWIEELSGMENDTLLQLGDSIRDEMSAEQAKTFISSVAPAIQQALENLKTTRETLSTGVRLLTGEEQGAEMLGGEPAGMGGDEMGPAEPDAMNMGGDVGDAGGEDEFAAAEPAAGGLGDAGREQRESINRSSSLLKVLAG